MRGSAHATTRTLQPPPHWSVNRHLKQGNATWFTTALGIWGTYAQSSGHFPFCATSPAQRRYPPSPRFLCNPPHTWEPWTVSYFYLEQLGDSAVRVLILDTIRCSPAATQRRVLEVSSVILELIAWYWEIPIFFAVHTGVLEMYSILLDCTKRQWVYSQYFGRK